MSVDPYSLLGHVVLRMGGPIAWDCKREPRSSRSVCQAEILSMDEGCKSTLKVRNVLTDLEMEDGRKPTPLFNDNRGAVDWSSGCNISKRLRHFNIREVAVRDDVEAGDITIKHLPGKCNIADIFTKEINCNTLFQSLAYQLISPRTLGEAGGLLESIVSSEPNTGSTKPSPVMKDDSHVIVASQAIHSTVYDNAQTGHY